MGELYDISTVSSVTSDNVRLPYKLSVSFFQKFPGLLHDLWGITQVGKVTSGLDKSNQSKYGRVQRT